MGGGATTFNISADLCSPTAVGVRRRDRANPSSGLGFYSGWAD
jgi:hypothetical protein